MKAPRLVIVIVLLSTFTSCSTNKAHKLDSAVDRYKALSVQKYGEGVEWIPNSTKTVVLCVKRSKPTDQLPQRQAAFFIYDVAADRITFEDEISNGSVAWKDNQSVMVEIVPGIEKGDEPSPPLRRGYVLDVRTGKTTDLERAVVR
jgi:hypothetical protein